LAVEMYRKNCFDDSATRSFENRFNGAGVQIERGRIDISKHGLGAGTKNSADRSEEAERSGHDGVAGSDAGGCKRQPERVRSRGASKRMCHTQPLGRCLFEDSYRLTKDELLGFQNVANRI